MAETSRLLGIPLFPAERSFLAVSFILGCKVISAIVKGKAAPYLFIIPGANPKCFLNALVKWAVCL
jgi:hypothetical protein